jgi:YD repeat-containing protein
VVERWCPGLVLAVAAIACARDRDSAEPPPPVAAIPRDARAVTPDAEPPWLADALARGGPGLCASIGDDDVLVWRRDADGRIVERLEFNAKHGAQPAERIELAYDSAGRLIKMVRRGATSHAFDATIDLWYDKAGRVERRREHPDDAAAFRPGDVNVTYRWQGKQLPSVVGRFPAEDRDDPTDPLAYALAFSGTVREARYYDRSPAPQPEREYTRTYDERGRLVDVTSTGWSDPSRHDKLEWDADDQLVAIRTGLSVTQFVWRDHRVVSTRYLDRTGKEGDHFEARYDASGRLVERVRFAPDGPRERITSSVVDREELVVTYVTEDGPAPRAGRSYRYDCAPAR